MFSDSENYYSAIESSSCTDDSFCSASDDGLSAVLRQMFNTEPRHLFNVCHINAQSIPSHYCELSETFIDTNVHAVLISETWLKPHLSSAIYPLPGFVLIRNDRIDRRGGGVAIYLRSDFTYKIVATSSSLPSVTAEYLFLEVWVKGAKTILGVVYCPPSVDYFSSLDFVLESLGSEYAHHIIMGDFNTNLLDQSCPNSRKLCNIIESASLSVLPLQATHNNRYGADTWLDLILTSNPSLVARHGQLTAPGFSHHDLIFLSYILKPPKSRPNVLYMRCFGRMDVAELSRDAEKLDWDDLMAAHTVEEMVQIFNTKVLALFDIHAPVKKIKLKRPPAPWITCNIRKAMRRRDRAFSKFKKDRTEDNWCRFKAVRNRCNQMVRNAKRRYILDNISSSSPANTWKFLRTLGIGKEKSCDFQETLDLDDLNRHFSYSSPMDHRVKCGTLDFLANLPRPNIDSFHFSPVGRDEIKKIILSIKSNAVGCDNITRRMVVLTLDHLLPTLCHIINSSFSMGLFPSLWRKAYVIPLAKVTNPTLNTHYRSISILPFLSKVLEACAHKQLSRFVHSNNLLSPLQSGFRPGHSTVSALLKVTDDVRAGMEDTKVTVLVLVDFSNAFNAVSHDILLSTLSYLMVSPEALDWFSSYLRGRQQSVRIGETSSDWCDLDSGVPQGGILSPLLFSVFINLITQNLRCAYHLYADDLQLYAQASVDNISTAVDKINSDLDHIRRWSHNYGITVNPQKFQAIIVGSQRLISRLDTTIIPSIIYDDTAVVWSPTVKDLGLLIDTTLSWRAHVTSVCQRVTGILRFLYRLKNFLPYMTKVMLVQTLILPLIDYGDVCYFDLNADLLNKLDRLLNNCIRFIFNIRKYDHISSYRSQLKWLPIRQRRSLRALTTLFSLLTSASPPSYLISKFQLLSASHDKSLRSSNNLLLMCPPHRSNFIHSSFSVQAILLWNALPLVIRTSTNRTAFKMKVRDLLLKEVAELAH